MAGKGGMPRTGASDATWRATVANGGRRDGIGRPSYRRAFRTLDTYNVNMPGQKRPSNTTVIALLNCYQCPTPFHAVRTRFMGSIASSFLDRSPLNLSHEIWGGELPPLHTRWGFSIGRWSGIGRQRNERGRV